MKPVPVIVGGVPEPMAALNKIKIVENNEPLVDIRKVCPQLKFMPDVGTPEGMTPFLRKTVAEMLDEASRKLSGDFSLYAISAWRSFKLQKAIWWTHYNGHKKLHPDWSEASLRRATNKYAAPVDNIAPPGHCTGSAIDVVLQKSDGSFVDLLPECGTDTTGLQKSNDGDFNKLLPEDTDDWTLGSTWTKVVDPKVKKTRMMLLETMLGVGFSNCRDEYWHYSYGDSGWAVRVGEKECPYGIAQLPK